MHPVHPSPEQLRRILAAARKVLGDRASNPRHVAELERALHPRGTLPGAPGRLDLAVQGWPASVGTSVTKLWGLHERLLTMPADTIRGWQRFWRNVEGAVAMLELEIR